MNGFFGQMETYRQLARIMDKCQKQKGAVDMTKADIHDLKNSIEDLCAFEDLIFNIDSTESFEKAKSLFPRYNNYYLQKVLIFAATPLNYKLYADLFKLTGKVEFDLEPEIDFVGYLYARKLVNKEAFYRYGPPNSEEYSLRSVKEYENPILPDTAKYFILHDDVNGYVTWLRKKKIPLVKAVNAHCNFADTRITHLSMACICKSINMVKFLFMNSAKIGYEETSEAVSSGCQQIISLFLQNDADFRDMASHALYRHHHELTKWLMWNYPNTDFSIDDCTFGFNTTMLLYFLNELNENVDYQQPSTQKTAIFYSIEHNDLIVTDYLLMQKGASWRSYDFNGRQPFTYVDTPEMLVILEQKLDKGYPTADGPKDGDELFGDLF